MKFARTMNEWKKEEQKKKCWKEKRCLKYRPHEGLNWLLSHTMAQKWLKWVADRGTQMHLCVCVKFVMKICHQLKAVTTTAAMATTKTKKLQQTAAAFPHSARVAALHVCMPHAGIYIHIHTFQLLIHAHMPFIRAHIVKHVKPNANIWSH